MNNSFLHVLEEAKKDRLETLLPALSEYALALERVHAKTLSRSYVAIRFASLEGRFGWAGMSYTREEKLSLMMLMSRVHSAAKAGELYATNGFRTANALKEKIVEMRAECSWF